MAKDKKRPIHVRLATDLRAGTSFSALQTVNEAYKIVAGALAHAREPVDA